MSVGAEAHRSDWLDHAVRVGLVAYGVVHLLVGWLAGQLALGDRSTSASNRGALHTLAEQPLGAVLVWLVAVGLALLVVWRVLEAGWGHREETDTAHRWRKRAVSLGKGAVYAVLATTAVKVAVGDGSRGGTRSATARVLDLPAGQWLVGAAGVAVVAYGLNLARRGVQEKFTEHLSAEGKTGEDGRAYLLTGKIGHVGKGAAIVVVGGLVCWAAVTHDARRSGGLDQALHVVLQQPAGSFLLLLIAVGIGCYGLFCLARARHLSRSGSR